MTDSPEPGAEAPSTPPPAPPSAPPFSRLTPDLILNAVDSVGLATSGQLLALNSYENRVFQVGLDDPGGSRAAPVVVKFYRPERWTDAAILEEHAFMSELVEAEVPAVAPLVIREQTLHQYEGFRFAVFERRGVVSGWGGRMDHHVRVAWPRQ